MTRTELVQATLLALTRQNVIGGGGGGSTDTELDFTLTSNLTQRLYLTQSAPGAVTVNWGDGSQPESPSALSAYLSHTYAEAGDYTVRISCATGETWSPGVSGSNYYGIIGKYTTTDTYPTLTSARLGVGARMNVRYSFTQCTGLSSVVMTENITAIPDYAFYKCTGLTSVTIPDSVTSIGDNAFRGCSGLTSVTIPDSVTGIGNSVFRDCSSLMSMTIPESVTSIGYDAFSGCSSLASVTIPENVTSISDSAFYGCSSLTSMTIPEGVTSIGSYAFYSCSSLASITIPSRVLGIGNSAFYSCSSLTSITCEAVVPPSIHSSTFTNVPATCPIYVPSASVSAYKTAFGWSDRAAYIQPIPTT